MRYPQWLAFDATADAIAADVDRTSGARDTPPAIAWLDMHTDKTRELQLRHPEGTYTSPARSAMRGPRS